MMGREEEGGGLEEGFWRVFGERGDWMGVWERLYILLNPWSVHMQDRKSVV